MMRKINKTILFYTVFALSILIVFLTVRFPGQAVGNYINATVAERYPGVFFSFESVSLGFPPGLKLENINVGSRDNLEANIRAEWLKVRPRLLGFLSGNSSFAVNALAYGGSVKAFVNFPGFSMKNAPSNAEVRFDGVNLDKCAYLKSKLGRRIAGILGGVYTFKGDSQVNFTVQSGSYQLLDNMFGFDRLDFNSVEGQFTLKGGVLKITKLVVKGDKINCSLKGDIIVNSDFKNSEINMSGSMEIAAMNNKKVSMLITGTLSNVKTRYL
jgi:type II secretion system protein N